MVTAAGMDVPGRLADVPAETWERIVAVDLLATAAVVRAALPYLERVPRHTSSRSPPLSGVKAVSDATAYCAAKFGVVGFTRALAAELAGRSGSPCWCRAACGPRSSTTATSSTARAPDATLNDPANVAAAVMFALSQPPGCAVRELVVCAEQESSYP